MPQNMVSDSIMHVTWNTINNVGDERERERAYLLYIQHESPYLLFIQHESLKLMCSPKVTFWSSLDAKNRFGDLELV